LKLEDALPYIDGVVGRRFNSVFDKNTLVDLQTNKGNVGQLLELVIGLKNTSRGLDFEDGELKTNKSYPCGRPKETMFITQILSNIDSIITNQPFQETNLYNKIKNLLYVPVCKDGNEENWFFLPYIHVNLESDIFNILYVQLEQDYYAIVEQLNDHIENSVDGFIHTANGKLIQIRSKDSKPYRPIYSKIYKRYVSNKNHAFYFKKDFMVYLQKLSPDYPFQI
jgi:DNA mismatch repair protein MutH